MKININSALVEVQKRKQQNFLSPKLPTANLVYGQISVRRNIRTAKFPTAKFPYNEISLRRNFFTAKIPTAKFPTAKFPSAVCQHLFHSEPVE